MTPSLLCIALALAAKPEAAVDFDTQVIPILTKAGCNAGTCHGSAAGRGGFRLSLFGGNPASDYQAIVRELEGRRINPARPAESLLVTKATESIRHGGGPRLEYEGPAARLLTRWIQGGAPRAKRRQLKTFQVAPKRKVLTRGSTVRLSATAWFDDGSREEVTRWTVFTAADPEAVEIDSDSATAIIRRGGQQIVIARYLDRVVPLEWLVPRGTSKAASREDVPGQPQHWIDAEINQTLDTLRLAPAGPCDDATFLRRARLDLTGTLPTPEEVEGFLADRRPRKREQLIERLLASDAFTDYWTYKLAKLLRIRSQPKDSQGARTFHQWLHEQVARNRPWDELAQRLITAEGDSHQNGPANFYRVVQGARNQAEYVSELFLGVRLRCANCHNHPLDRWTQDDYHGLAAIFAKVESGRVVRVGPRGEVTHPRTGEAALARIPGERFLAADERPRKALARWLTDPDNPYFARAIVNRLWKALMGRGLVEPADDLRATNPGTHPRLLGQLAQDFVAHDYDLRHTLRLIATTDAYARSSRPADADNYDDRFYGHALCRPLESEVYADAVVAVTGVSEPYKNVPAGTRAIALFDPQIPSDTLDILGRCGRESSCETAAGDRGLPARLHLLNGDFINAKLQSPQGRLRRLLASGKSNEEIAAALYLRALSRPPTQQERAFLRREWAQLEGREREAFFVDLAWSLLNGREFTHVH